MSDHTSYADIAPLVAGTDEMGTALGVLFRCPATGFEVRSEGRWEQDGVVRSQAKVAKRTLLATLRNKVAQQVRGAGGSTMMGSIAGTAGANLAQQAGNDYSSGPVKRSDKDREKATVRAFEAVRASFVWDAGGARWVAATSAQAAVSPFSEHLAAHPVTEAYDVGVLHRLLAALIASDGSVEDEERASFADLAPGVDLDALLARRAPGAVDFEETKRGPSRETFLLVGWAVALSDQELAPEEAALLATAATGLGIGEARAAELKELSQRHLVDQAIEALHESGVGRDDLRTQVEDLGEAIGLGADEAARVVIRWSKRG